MTTVRAARRRAAALMLALALTPVLTPIAAAQLDADFSVNLNAGTNPFEVQFTDATTGGQPFTWSWDFGDGNHSQQQHPSHTYTLPGTHTVSLTVLGPGLQIDEEVKLDLITVAPLPLTAAFSATGAVGDNPLTVSFTDQSAGTPPTAWLWDFGDGAQSTAQHPDHVYDTPGSYDVSLTAFVGQQSHTTTQPGLVTVDPTTLIAAFTPAVIVGDSPLHVDFTDTSNAGAPVTAWLWDFGDGGTSTAEAPSHTYLVEEETRFDVSLTVFVGGQSDAVTVVDAVTVKPSLFDAPFQIAVFWPDNVNLLDVADLDGDGLQDVLLFLEADGQSTGRFAYASNQGPPGSLAAPVPFGPAMTQEQFSAWTGDPDGDGDLDVLYRWHAGGGLAWIEHLDGVGGFAAAEALLVSATQDPFELLLVDLDGDGDDDVVTAQGDVRWYEHLDGAGSYGPGQVLEDELFVVSIATDDLDGDGDLDLVAGVSGLGVPRGLLWYEHLDGMGSFGPAKAVHAHQTGCVWVAAHDLDGDGDGDLIGRYIDLDYTVSGYQVYENVDGQGTYVLARVLGSYVNSVTEFVLDPDGDGDLDLIEVRRDHTASGGIWWAENSHGGGLLEPWKQLASQKSAYFPLFGDIDDDGDSDLVYYHALTSAMTSTNRLGSVAWPFLGDGLQGALGMPRLQGEGALIGGESVSLRLSNGLPGAPSTLVVGLSLLAAPLKGGVLVPNPDELLTTGPLDGEGELQLEEAWPLGIPAGVPLWFQWWLVDGSGPLGFTSSNGVMATTGG